ncbi:tyrosine-protein kinase receptor torso-like [Aphidius gifuensis]|uniref:tyrosine-protein kinase receptor torso-like n=1 Tax=Aphidius gifuensis TaxID=684658 RepID=UPI001CDBA310|nr:tyrosine-protein kinase receptor torso-like [Aphidius gifuensis]
MISIIFMFLFFGYTCGNFLNNTLQYAECLSHCYDQYCPEICNGTTHQGPAMFEAELHCRDTDLLSLHHSDGIFIIQQSTSNITWSKPRVVQGIMSIFSGLKPGQFYRYRVKRVENNSVSKPELTGWFQTIKNDEKPEGIREINVQDIVPISDDIHHLQAQVTFEPGQDLSCYYDVLNWSEKQGLSIGHVNATQYFKFQLNKLDYYCNNTITILATNKGTKEKSNNVSMIIKTPSCLESHKSLIICAPNKVSGLRVKKLQQFDDNIKFQVSWDKPKFLPDNYTVLIEPFDHSKKQITINLSGNLTEFFYYLDEIGLPHVISIVAESHGGISQPISIMNTIKFEKRKQTIINDILIILSSFGMVILAGVIYIYYKNKKTTIKNQYNYCSNINDKVNLAEIYEKSKIIESDIKMEIDPLLSKDEFEIHPVQLRIGKILGSGVSGIVRLGSLEVNNNDWIQVAVKMLQDGPSEDDVKNFKQEILIMKSAGIHRNIVSMIGCCTTSIKPMLIVEYCSQGDLQTYLRNIWNNLLNDANNRKIQIENIKLCHEKNSDIISSMSLGSEQTVAISNQLYDLQQGMLNTKEEISASDLLSFAHQVAIGMEFLSMNRIVHRDLAARNVLVCSDKTVKISDFGLSRDVYQENIYRKQGNGKLPIKWMAIEALTHQIYTTKSDVWSYGILLWEIVTLGCSPYPDISTSIVLELLKEGYRMPRPQNCGIELYEIMRSCWNTRPRCRPTFTKLKQDMDKLLETVSQNDYLNLCNLQQERDDSITDSE